MFAGPLQAWPTTTDLRPLSGLDASNSGPPPRPIPAILKVMKRFLLPFLLFVFAAPSAFGMGTELGVSYGLKKTAYDASNDTSSESVSASVSLYFTERIAVELSYTTATGVDDEKIVAGSNTITNQTIVQKTEVYGADLILILLDRSSWIQPYIKGGAAQVNRTQQVDDKILSTVYTIPKVSAVAPSYGAGFKIQITDQFGIKVSYDVQQTPLGNGIYSNDEGVRAGVTWMF